MLVTPLGMMVFLHPATSSFVFDLIMALQLSRESYTLFPSETTIEANASQDSVMPKPIFVTLLGIVIDNRL